MYVHIACMHIYTHTPMMVLEEPEGEMWKDTDIKRIPREETRGPFSSHNIKYPIFKKVNSGYSFSILQTMWWNWHTMWQVWPHMFGQLYPTPSSLPTKWVWGYLGIGLFVWFFVCFFPVQTICTWIAYNQSVCVVVVNLNFFLLAHRPSECANPPVQRHH